MGNKSALEMRGQVERAWALKVEGVPLAQAAQRMGVSTRTYERYIERAVEWQGADDADTLRTVVEARLDQVRKTYLSLMAQAWNEDVQSWRDPSLAVKAANGLLAVERDRAKLLGIVVPASLVVKLEGRQDEVTITDDGLKF
jgi:hypothetical protein